MRNDTYETRRTVLLIATVIASLTACGGDDDDDSASAASAAGDAASTASDPSGDTGSAAITDAPPPGQARASVDGLDVTFELPGALGCTVSDESITYSYRIGDNEITLGAGFNRVDGGWMGSFDLTVANPSDEPGPIAYYPAPGELGVLEESLITIDGNVVRYSGPVLKQPANDGSQPPPVEVGTGTITATC